MADKKYPNEGYGTPPCMDDEIKVTMVKPETTTKVTMVPELHNITMMDKKHDSASKPWKPMGRA